MTNKKMNCLRCRGEMLFQMRKKIQLGQTGWVLGDLPNLVAGALEMDIYACSECGKAEFFLATPADDGDRPQIAQTQCPQCGRQHDIDYPKCPFCHYLYH